MRLWASSDTITFDEFATKGFEEVVEVAFGLNPSYVRRERCLDPRGWPIDLTELGAAKVQQIQNPDRTATAVTGQLRRIGTSPPRFRLDSQLTMRIVVGRKTHWNSELAGILGKRESVPCHAFGRLSLRRKELNGETDTFYKARILRYLSLCLHAGDARFGEWFEVKNYSEISADPDVMDSPVLIAELALLSLSDAN